MSTRQDKRRARPWARGTISSPGSRRARKPAEHWRIGTEHEKFLFHVDTLRPVPYAGPRGVRALMQSLIDRFGWLPIMEGDNIIALKRPDGEAGGTVSLEPGGQFELSGEPLADRARGRRRDAQAPEPVPAASARRSASASSASASRRNWTLDETPRMPKQRYGVMTRYMPKVGSRGLDMMYRTCTIQVNLDFADEADMVKKFRVSLALQPIATAIFACSPFTEGKPNGFLSMRSEVWRDTDQRRTGMLPFVFEPGMSFERYADYALDVPMYFVYRDGRYIDAAGASFRDFLAGKLAQLPGERPTLDDWSDHLTTLFPEVRMKRFLEMRGADGGRWRRICAAAGVLDRPALRPAPRSMPPGTWSRTGPPRSARALRDAVPRTALRTPVPQDQRARDRAPGARHRACRPARRAPARQARAGTRRTFLEPVEAILREGCTPAEEMLARYEATGAAAPPRCSPSSPSDAGARGPPPLSGRSATYVSPRCIQRCSWWRRSSGRARLAGLFMRRRAAECSARSARRDTSQTSVDCRRRADPARRAGWARCRRRRRARRVRAGQPAGKATAPATSPPATASAARRSCSAASTAASAARTLTRRVATSLETSSGRRSRPCGPERP